MMRLLVVTPYYRSAYIYGGPARSVPELCEGISRLGHAVTVYTTDANGADRLKVPTCRPLNVDGVEVVYFPRLHCWLTSTYFFSPELRKTCYRDIGRFDAVYLNATWTYPFLAGTAAAYRHDVPYVISPRGSFMQWSMSQKRPKKLVYLQLFERKWIERAAAIHCTGILEAEQTQMLGFCPPLFVVPNPVSVPKGGTLFYAREFRARLGVPEQGTLSIFIGRKHRMKRLDMMIEAFSRLVSRLPTAHLAIVGPDGGVENELRTLTQRLRMERHIHFFGLVEGADLANVYLAADMLVMLSWRENFGMAAGEALSQGVPVLLADDVGIAGEVAMIGAGRVVHANVVAVEEAWHSMLTEGCLREMGNRGRKYAVEKLSGRAVAEQMLKALQNIGISSCQTCHGSSVFKC